MKIKPKVDKLPPSDEIASSFGDEYGDERRTHKDVETLVSNPVVKEENV